MGCVRGDMKEKGASDSVTSDRTEWKKERNDDDVILLDHYPLKLNFQGL